MNYTDDTQDLDPLEQQDKEELEGDDQTLTDDTHTDDEDDTHAPKEALGELEPDLVADLEKVTAPVEVADTEAKPKKGTKKGKQAEVSKEEVMTPQDLKKTGHMLPQDLIAKKLEWTDWIDDGLI